MYSLLVHDNDTDPEIAQADFNRAKSIIFRSRYRERFGLSAVEYEREPINQIAENRVIWGYDSERQELEEARRKGQQANNGIDSP